MDNIPCDPTLPMRVREVPSFTTTDVSPPDYRRRFLIILAILFLLFFPVIMKTYHSCVICGMGRTEQRIVGILVSTSERDRLSNTWYRDNVEPQHEHIWARGGFSQFYSVFGIRVFMMQDLPGKYSPFMGLIIHGGQRHIDIYKNSPDPIRTRDLLVRLSKWEPDGTNARKQQWEIFKQFQKWKESHFEDPWPFETQ